MAYIHDDRDIVHKPYNQDFRKPVLIGNSYSHPRRMYHTVAKPELSPRTIVLCFDGTGNKFGEVLSTFFNEMRISCLTQCLCERLERR